MVTYSFAKAPAYALSFERYYFAKGLADPHTMVTYSFAKAQAYALILKDITLLKVRPTLIQW